MQLINRRIKSVELDKVCASRRLPSKPLLPLEHVPKKLIDFSDQNMLQLFEFERFLFDQMI